MATLHSATSEFPKSFSWGVSMASIFDLVPDPTPDEILARRIEIHRRRGEHDEADALAKSGGADTRPHGVLSAVRVPAKQSFPLSPSKRKRIHAMIAAGVQQRKIAAIVGVNRWTVWAALRRLKAEVRSMIDAGATPKQIRERIGQDAWAAWERSQMPRRTRKPKDRSRFRCKPAWA